MDLPFTQYGWAIKTDELSCSQKHGAINYIGHMQSAGGFTYEQVSKSFALHCVLSGEGFFKCNDKTYPGNQGDLFLFFPDDHVVYWDNAENSWEYIWFVLEGQNIEESLDVTGLTKDTPSVSLADCSGVRRMFKKMSMALKENKYSIFYPVHLYWELLDYLCEQLNYEKKPSSLAKEAYMLMSNDLYFSRNINEIASHLKVDRTTLFRAFIKEYGVSPLYMLNELRMRHACDLLSTSNMGIAEISQTCGFSTSPYFSNCFRKYFGMSPTQWRDEA